MKHLSLCSGIGGLDLAAEWAGFETVAQCEIDEYASKVLAKNFKGVPNLHDIRTVTNERLRECGVEPSEITVISAGFPCQPYSLAGKGLGDSDSRDLWSEVARVLGEVKPRWFVGENTPGLFSRENQRYFRRILDDLAALGYSVGWGIWGAADVGAPHKRDRVFIVAHADGERRNILGTGERQSRRPLDKSEAETFSRASGLYREVFNPACVGRQENDIAEQCACKPLVKPGGGYKLNRTDSFYGVIPYAVSKRRDACEIQRGEFKESRRTASTERIQESGCQLNRVCNGISYPFGRRGEYVGEKWWQTEPDVGRVANGIPARVDRLRCLGNAVVPAQAYPIFDVIAELEEIEQ